MNLGKRMGLATASAALVLWPQVASAQDTLEPEQNMDELEIQVTPAEEEPAPAEEETEIEVYREEPAAAEGGGSGSGEIIVEQPAPEIILEQPRTDVKVQQPAPRVRVEQPTPDVRLERVGEPKVRVEQPVDVEVQQGEEEIIEERRVPAEDEVIIEERRIPAEEDLEDVMTPIDTGALNEPAVTPFGTTLQVSGGVRNFIGNDIQDLTSVGGYWDVRAAVGSRSIIGLEGAYTGSAQDIAAVGLSEDSFLLSNGLEANLRLNAPIPIDAAEVPVLIEPYALAGLGWQYWNLVNEGVNTSSVSSDDNVMTVPLGVGLSVGLGGLVLDGRFTYRQTFFNDLLGTPTSSFSSEALNQWQLGAGLGFEF